MNPVDTLRLVLDRQAAMRREARIHAIGRSARQRHHAGFSHDEGEGAAGNGFDPIGPRQFLDR